VKKSLSRSRKTRRDAAAWIDTPPFNLKTLWLDVPEENK
jgi:hypothetical protein